MARTLLLSFLVLAFTVAARAESRIDFVARVFLTTPEAQYTSTGILIRRDLILTNHHAIRGDGKVTVELASGDTVPATVLKSTDVQDLALLQISPVSAPTCKFGDTPRRDQSVRIHGFARGTTYRASGGIVTGPARPANTDRDTMFTADAGVVQGMSGGPVLNDKGQLVGVLFGGDEKGSFCVDVKTVREFLGPLESVKSKTQAASLMGNRKNTDEHR
jgi:S1-C subfamily serine protease